MDAVVVGGGLVGLACTRALAGLGLDVKVVDDGAQPASWAAAGILGPQSESHGAGPALELGLASLALWPKFVEDLGDVGYQRCGTLHLAFDDASAAELDARARWQRAAGLEVEDRNDGRARRAIFFPREGTVDNRRVLARLRELTAQHRIDDHAIEVNRTSVVLEHGGTLHARCVVLAAGAWSSKLAPVPVFPVRGEMIALDVPAPPSIVFGDHGYVVPRADHTLIGATSEEVGFNQATTPQGREALLRIAARLLPGAEKARVIDHWAGLRPGSRDSLPFVGALPNGVIAATGHFRNGILLTPITAQIVQALVTGDSPPIDLAPFSPNRRLP